MLPFSSCFTMGIHFKPQTLKKVKPYPNREHQCLTGILPHLQGLMVIVSFVFTLTISPSSEELVTAQREGEREGEKGFRE